jgi:methionyl-tRNA formyltransferase
MIQSLKLVFCGTPRFAVPTLDRLVDAGFQVSLVVTQPDRPKGRGLELVASPVKQRAVQLGLPITQPEKIKNNDDFRSQLTGLEPDAIIVVGYGRIIPQWMLDLPPLGNINLHASLLPKYRGAAPIQWAIAQGEAITGVTTMKIDAGLDTVTFFCSRKSQLLPRHSGNTGAEVGGCGSRFDDHNAAGIADWHGSSASARSLQATLAPILKKEDGLIDFFRPAIEILNRLRGFQPWPGAHSKFRGKNLQVWQAALFDQALPSSELKVEGNQLLIGCGEGTAIELLELQLEGKKRTSGADFIRGYRPSPGERLGS